MRNYVLHKCKFGYGGNVRCKKKECAKCGWNPEVAQARLDAILEKMMKESKTK